VRKQDKSGNFDLQANFTEFVYNESAKIRIKNFHLVNSNFCQKNFQLKEY